MTLREKQIDEFANSQVDCEFFNEDLYKGIIIGAKWADKNPKDGMVSIDKACEWLKNTIDDDVFINCGSVIKFMPANEFVEYFRKAMEE